MQSLSRGFDGSTQSKLSYGGDADAFIDALNIALADFGGSVLGNAPDGTVDVEFATVRDAYDFLGDVKMTDAAILRDPVRSLADHVVIIFSLPLFMYRQAMANRSAV